MRKLNIRRMLLRRKVIQGGKVRYIDRKYSGGKLLPVTRVQRLGRTHLRVRSGSASVRSHSVPVSKGGRARSKHSVGDSIMKSLTKHRTGGTLSRYL